ncbi:MAG: hypothetical protein ACI4S2_12315 [Lachnospiraceae bacterium]
MTEWGVFLVIVSLITFATAIITPIIKLNTSIVRLTDSVTLLEKSLDNMADSNSRAHKRIWDQLDEHGEKLNAHENDILLIKEREKERERHDKFNM